MKADDSMTAPLTLGKAAKLLGIEGPDAARLLRRRLLAFEEELGRPLMRRVGGPVRTRYLVTLGTIKRAIPEWFRDELAEDEEKRRQAGIALIREEVGQIQDLAEMSAGRTVALAKEIAAIHSRLDAIERRFRTK